MQLAILFILVVLVLKLFSGSREEIQIKETITTHTDTLWLRDTIEIEKPIYISKTIIDSILVSVQKIDTVFITLPREQKYYKDAEYEAWISGFQPELDSLKLYTEETLITNQYHHQTQVIQKQRQKRFGIGIQVGYGVSIDENLNLSTYIGIGISYNFITF